MAHCPLVICAAAWAVPCVSLGPLVTHSEGLTGLKKLVFEYQCARTVTVPAPRGLCHAKPAAHTFPSAAQVPSAQGNLLGSAPGQQRGKSCQTVEVGHQTCDVCFLRPVQRWLPGRS